MIATLLNTPFDWQWIITMLIVFAAIAYAAYQVLKAFYRPPTKSRACNGCAYDCTACPSNQVIQQTPTVSCKNI